MNRDRFDHSLSGWLADQSSTPTYLDEAMARTRATRQRPAWSFPERWLPMQLTMRPAYVPRQFFYLALVGLLIGGRRCGCPRDRRRPAGGSAVRSGTERAPGVRPGWLDHRDPRRARRDDGRPDDDPRRVRSHLRARRDPSRVLRRAGRGRRPVRGAARRQRAKRYLRGTRPGLVDRRDAARLVTGLQSDRLHGLQCRSTSPVRRECRWFREGRDRHRGDLAIDPAWSPDGQWIAFQGGGTKKTAEQALYLIRPDGTDEHRGDLLRWLVLLPPSPVAARS